MRKSAQYRRSTAARMRITKHCRTDCLQYLNDSIIARTHFSRSLASQHLQKLHHGNGSNNNASGTPSEITNQKLKTHLAPSPSLPFVSRPSSWHSSSKPFFLTFFAGFVSSISSCSMASSSMELCVLNFGRIVRGTSPLPSLVRRRPQGCIAGRARWARRWRYGGSGRGRN